MKIPLRHIFLLQAIFAILCIVVSEADAQLWQQTNGPGGAGIHSIAMSAEGDLYVWSNAFYRSTDNGHSWQSQTIPEFYNCTITTGAANEVFLEAQSTLSGRGLWRSIDRGDHWAKISIGPLAAVLDDGSIYVSDTNGYLVSTDHGSSWKKQFTYGIDLPGKLFVKPNGIRFLIAPNSVLYRSEDTGRTWTKTSSSTPASNFAISPSGSIFACGYLVNATNHLFKSTDEGLTWKFDSINTYDGRFLYKCKGLAISQNGRILYISDNSCHISDDDGKNWKSAPTVSGAVCRRDSAFFCFRSFDNSLLLNSLTGYAPVQTLSIPDGSVWLFAFSNKTLIASGGHDWITIDDGDYWSYPASKAVHPTLRSNSSIVTDSQKTILALSDSSVLQSTDNGISWSKRSTLIGTGQSIVVHPSGDIFVAVNDNGVDRSTDNGNTWKISNYGILESTVSAVAVDHNGVLYAGAASGLYRSNDRGSTWTKESGFLSKAVTSIINDPVNAE